MKNKRNSTIFWNKNRKKYNCGAYALNLNYWYMPFSNTFIREKHITDLIGRPSQIKRVYNAKGVRCPKWLIEIAIENCNRGFNIV